MPKRLNDFHIIDTEGMGLESAFKGPRPIGITEFAMKKYKQERVTHLFTNILQSDVEKALQGQITSQDLLKRAMSESRLLHFSRGVMIPKDIEHQVFLQYIEGVARGKSVTTVDKMLDQVTEKLEKGGSVGSWNINYDFKNMYGAAQRSGNKKFIKAYQKALEEGRVIDVAEGVHKYMWETLTEKFPGFEVMHRTTSEEVPRTLHDILLAEKDPEKVAGKWLHKHENLHRLRDNLIQNVGNVEYNIKSYEGFKAWSEARAAAGVGRPDVYRAFGEAADVSSLPFTKGWSLEHYKRSFSARITEKSLLERVSKRIGVKPGLLKHHIPTYDIGLAELVMELFDTWGTGGEKRFESALRGYGFQNRADFHQELAKQRRAITVEQEKKAYFEAHSHLTSKMARSSDEAHAIKNVEQVLTTHTMEGLGIEKEAQAATKSFLKKGFPAGFKDAGNEIMDAARRWNKAYPKASLLLGIGAAALMVDSLIPSKAKRATPPYEDIEGRRSAYSRWQQIRGLRPSHIGPPTDFGSARSWFSQLDHATRIFYDEGRTVLGMGATELLYLKHGEKYARQELAFTEIVHKITRIKRMAKEPINLTIPWEAAIYKTKEPLRDMVERVGTQALSSKDVYFPAPNNMHAFFTKPGRTTSLKDAVSTPFFVRSEEVTTKAWQDFARRYNTATDWGMETLRGTRTAEDLEWTGRLKHLMGLETGKAVNVPALSEAVVPRMPGRNFIPRTMRRTPEGYVSERLMARAGDKILPPFMGGYTDKPVQFQFHQFAIQRRNTSLHAHRPDMVMGMQREGMVDVLDDLSPFIQTPKAVGLERVPISVPPVNIEGVRQSTSMFTQIQGMNYQVAGDFAAGRVQPWGSPKYWPEWFVRMGERVKLEIVDPEDWFSERLRKRAIGKPARLHSLVERGVHGALAGKLDRMARVARRLKVIRKPPVPQILTQPQTVLRRYQRPLRHDPFGTFAELTQARVDSPINVLKRKSQQVIAQSQARELIPNLGGMLSGASMTAGIHFGKKHYKQYIKLFQTEFGYSEGYAKYVVEHRMGMRMTPGPVDKVPRAEGSGKGFWRGTVGGLFKGGASALRTPFRQGFWGPAVKTAWEELKAYPRLAKDIWRSGVSLSKRTWWLNETFMGVLGDKPATAMSLAIERGHIKGPEPPRKFIFNRRLQEGKESLSRQLDLAADRLSGGNKAGRGVRGFVSRRVRNVGKFAKYASGHTVLNMAFLGMHLTRAGEYESKIGGVISETAAFTGGFAAWTIAGGAASKGVEAGILSALGKSVLPGWGKVAMYAASFLIGDKAYVPVADTIRNIGHSLFGTVHAPMNQEAMDQMARPDYWNAHVAYKNSGGYNAYDGINVSGMNLTPFRSRYDAEADPAMLPPRMRKRVRRTRFPRTSGLVQVMWKARKGSRINSAAARSAPIPVVTSQPRPRYDRGVAA